ncbi:MAG: GNAT family N-acetyltransferase [Ruminococcaceae bacterium]|nr:GNAT family N-acetyltransferase [Oscillospiraceae bacterium]
MMEILPAKKEHLPQMASLEANLLEQEYRHVPALRAAQAEAFLPLLEERLSEGNAWVAQFDDTVLGYLMAGEGWVEDGVQCYHVPVWGSGSAEAKDKILPKIFAHAAETLVTCRPVRFEWDLYAHDDPLIRAVSRLQFGIQYEEALRDTAEEIPDDSPVSVREWGKAELASRWGEVWALLSLLIRHLQKSPVFYPGKEFTEEVYRAFLLDPDTRLFAAEQDGVLCGIIEANRESRAPLTAADAWDVGEACVLPALRRQGIARALLRAVNETLRQEDVSQLWVGHGTANFSACGFWNRYFTPYLVTMLRQIQPI